jgi:NADPH:quinone reductase-like Zn-dependent oxidoreductase
MKAIWQDRYGSPDALQLKDIPRPVIDDDGVLVRVVAASVNALDWHIMRGEPLLGRAVMGLRKPKERVRGVDVSGCVEAVGKNVTSLRPGDEVFGATDGAFAEYAAGSESTFVRKPSNITFEQAAAVPIAALTALQGLRDAGQVKPGQRVLINGAGGGVGTFAVQIAGALGAHVIGVTCMQNMELVRSIGADQVIDYTKEDFTRSGQRYDLICTIGGHPRLSDFRRAMTPEATVVIVGADNPLSTVFSSRFHRRMGSFLARRNKDDLLVLKELIEAGKVMPVIDRSFPLAQAADAIRYLETGRARGKVVITV